MDFNLYQMGKEFKAYDFFGAHYDGKGTQFRTHAPNARSVYLIGDFNQYQGQPMNVINGVWELYVKDAEPGHTYKYRIEGPSGHIVDHADPYAFQSELRPKTASVIYEKGQYKFSDDDWINSRTNNMHNKPMSIYELHLGSWKTKVHELGDYDENGVQIIEPEDNWYTYTELAQPLAEYVKEQGFTHVEILPLTEHPLDLSWGYLPTGFYSATSRYGSPDELKYLIDVLHQNEIGVILDWVPVHFPSNTFLMNRAKGMATSFSSSTKRLYETTFGKR